MSSPNQASETTARATQADATAAEQRSSTLDVLRGMAIFGILAANIEAFVDPGYAYRTQPTAGLDTFVTHLITFVIEAKFYVLFSFLFGYGLAIQIDSAARRGTTAVPRLLRRLLLLFLLGAAHGVLLFSGDILMIYALAGLPVLFLRNRTPRGSAAVGFSILGCYVALVGALVVLTATAPSGPVGDPAHGTWLAEQALANYRGDFGDIVGQRVHDLGRTIVDWWVMVPIVFGYFMLGFASGRAGLLHRRTFSSRALVRASAIGLLIGIPTALGFTILSAGSSPLAEAAEGLGYFTAPALTIAYGALLLLIGRTRAGGHVHAALAPVGRLALTNYLTQSLVCALLFTGYGLSLAGSIGPAGALLVAVLVFTGQVVASGWWVRRYAFGPVEWMLRSFTYLKPQPWRHRTSMVPTETTNPKH